MCKLLRSELLKRESVLLSAMGGIVGAELGADVTAIYATDQKARIVIPPEAILAALLIGAIAGLHPSMRFARLSPTKH